MRIEEKLCLKLFGRESRFERHEARALGYSPPVIHPPATHPTRVGDDAGTQDPAAPLTGDTAMGLHLWACSVWRWGAFDGPSPSRNAGRVCMVTGDLHTRSSNTSAEHATRETRGTMQLTDGRDRLNACNYDRPRKGPIAIARSAARRGADRTARARCVQQTNINSLSFCLPQLTVALRSQPEEEFMDLRA